MKCLDCKHGIPEKGKVMVSFNRDNSIVIIKEVPAMLCPVCGAYYLDEDITEKIIETSNSAIKNGAEIEVIRLKAA